MNKIAGFTFYRSYYESVCDLKENDKKEMINAILEYVFEDKKPNFKGIKKTFWTLIEPNLNTSKNRSNENSGAPKGNKNACKIRENEEKNNLIKKQSKNNQNSINDLYDKDKDKERDKDKDKDKDSEVCVINNTLCNDPPHDLDTIFNFALSLEENYEEKSLKTSCKKFFNWYEEKKWKGVNNWHNKLELWLNDDLEKGKLKLKKEKNIEIIDGIKYENGKRLL